MPSNPVPVFFLLLSKHWILPVILQRYFLARELQSRLLRVVREIRRIPYIPTVGAAVLLLGLINVHFWTVLPGYLILLLLWVEFDRSYDRSNKAKKRTSVGNFSDLLSKDSIASIKEHSPSFHWIDTAKTSPCGSQLSHKHSRKARRSNTCFGNDRIIS